MTFGHLDFNHRCLSPVAYCLLLIVFCLLPVVSCLLSFACCLLPVAHCLLPVVRRCRLPSVDFLQKQTIRFCIYPKFIIHFQKKSCMNTKTLKIQGALICIMVLSSLNLLAQGSASPADSAKGKIGDATVSINYNSPSVKGRKIWGELVPYDKAWRAGANRATTLTTDKALKVEGKELPAGTYSVFAIPGEKEWQVVFNSEVGQWGVKRTGEANYDPAKNVLVVNVKPKKSSSMNERLRYNVNGKGVVLSWENLEVPIAMR
jgi:hypothetical protein